MDSGEEAGTLSADSFEDEIMERLPSRKKRNSRKKMNIIFLARNVTASRDTCLDWLKDAGFIPKTMFCPSCQRKMKFESNDLAIDGYVWSCNECSAGQTQLSARHGSWMEGRDAPLVDVLMFTYWWAYGATLEQIAKEVNMPLSTVSEWNVAYLNICASVCEKKQVPDDEFASENALEKKMSCASMWRRKNKHRDLFLEFLKIADSL